MARPSTERGHGFEAACRVAFYLPRPGLLTCQDEVSRMALVSIVA